MHPIAEPGYTLDTFSQCEYESPVGHNSFRRFKSGHPDPLDRLLEVGDPTGVDRHLPVPRLLVIAT